MQSVDTIAITRRQSRKIWVGQVAVGGDAPISVQSMTNTDTMDVDATCAQIRALAEAGADIVRVSVPTLEAAEAFDNIRKRIQSTCSLPLVADIHFDYRIALKVVRLGVDCLRLNPGNIGRRERIQQVVHAASDAGVPIRIGVNAGSLERDLLQKYHEPCADALVESALRHAAILDEYQFQDFKVSVKASDLHMAVAAYRKLAATPGFDQPIHLGITEAGGLRNGIGKSALGLGMLLMEGIGDTLRFSLASDPVDEVRAGWDLLKHIGLRQRGVELIACPSCSRQNFDVIGVVNQLEQRLEDITQPIRVAIIGCYVNGPGEARMVDIGVTGASPSNMIFIDGKPAHKVESDQLVDQLEKQVRHKITQRAQTIVTA